MGYKLPDVWVMYKQKKDNEKRCCVFLGMWNKSCYCIGHIQTEKKDNAKICCAFLDISRTYDVLCR